MAVDSPGGAGVTRRLLVVDWDYFFPLVEDIDPDAPPVWALYDWGHQEGRDIFYNHLWVGRAASFKRAGLDLPGTSGAERDFWKRFRLAPDATLTVTDSNAKAYNPDYGKLGAVYLYDAHHDAGYKGTMTDIEQRGKVSCEDWMGGYYLDGVPNLLVRYPPWRTGVFTWEPETVVPVDRRFDDGLPVGLTFHHVFICRSGAWTPPWIDPSFDTFVAACPVRDRVVDDTVAPRQWDEAAVDEELRIRRELEGALKQQYREGWQFERGNDRCDGVRQLPTRLQGSLRGAGISGPSTARSATPCGRSARSINSSRRARSCRSPCWPRSQARSVAGAAKTSH